MIKHIIVALVLVVGLSGLGNAVTDIQTTTISLTGGINNDDYTSVGDSLINNQGIVGNYSLQTSFSYTATSRWFNKYSAIIKSCIEPTDCGCDANANCGSATYAICYTDYRSLGPPQAPPQSSSFNSGYMTGQCFANTYACLSLWIRGSYQSSTPAYGHVKAYVIYTDGYIYTISGITECLDNVSLYYNNSGTWTYMCEDYLDDNYYSFNVTTGTDFKLLFNDGHSYEFNVTGNTVYNYDGCSHTQYRFEESCRNLIPDSEGYYCENWIGGGGICYNFYESDGILDISNTSASSIELYTNTFIGQTGWLIDPVVSDTTYTEA
jgi:hypothetical protein